MAAPDYEFVALHPISVGGVLAFNTGDLVPAGHLETLGLEVGVSVEARDIPEPDGAVIPGIADVLVAENTPAGAAGDKGEK